MNSANRSLRLPLVLLCLTLSFLPGLTADVRLPTIFGDRMVLQQEQPNRIWGWDDPGARVTVSFAGQTETAVADAQGKWEVALNALPASFESLLMEVEGTSRVELRDVLIGEVWVCSGQSNMSWPVRKSVDGDLAGAGKVNRNLRLITVPRLGTQELQEDFEGAWSMAGGEVLADFSAVAYYFGDLLSRTLDVPVGLIHCSWGGSAAEAWVPRAVIENDPRFANEMDAWREVEAEFDFERELARYEEQLRVWKTAASEPDRDGRVAPKRPRQPKNVLAGQHRPGNLYAGMLHPIVGYGIRGVIWYQGENNVSRAGSYYDLFSLLIHQWREKWAQGSFPFYWVQLANYRPAVSEPQESAWAELREAQTKTLESVVDGGQAVTIDIGEGKDIHPRNKRDVAYRLARWALANDYGIDIAYRSPQVATAERRDSRVLVEFDHTGGGLRAFGVSEVIGFSVAGEDGLFEWAEARIVSPNTVEVWSETVTAPVAVRYAWADNPVCNLYSAEGLPTTPFRISVGDTAQAK